MLAVLGIHTFRVLVLFFFLDPFLGGFGGFLRFFFRVLLGWGLFIVALGLCSRALFLGLFLCTVC